MNSKPTEFSDTHLTSFLDGAVDPVLAEQIEAALINDQNLASRLEALRKPVDLIHDALDLDALDPPELPKHILTSAPHSRPKVWTPIAFAASFVLGAIFAAGLLWPSHDWVDRVASYQALYVTETLDGAVQDPKLTKNALELGKMQLGMAIDAAPEITGMVFKRAQMLAVEGQPLMQLAYLSQDGTPFALCIMRVNDNNRSFMPKTSHGLAAVSWVENGLGFVIIGGTDTDLAVNLARDVTEML